MQPEKLIPQPELRRLFGGVSDMTIWRWREAKLLPQPIIINRRNFYRAGDIAAMQQRLETARVEDAAYEGGGDGDG